MTTIVVAAAAIVQAQHMEIDAAHTDQVALARRAAGCGAEPAVHGHGLGGVLDAGGDAEAAADGQRTSPIAPPGPPPPPVRIDRIEPSGLGVPVDKKFEVTGRSRRSVALDFKQPEGIEAALRDTRAFDPQTSDRLFRVLSDETPADDADLPGGRDMVTNHVVPDGTGVWWAYAVTNTGNVTLTDVQVVDDHVGVVCSGVTLAAGATGWCVIPGVVNLATTTAGQYGNTGTATGVDTVSNPSAPVTVGPVSDPTHVFVPTPAISLKKYTNDQDADTPDTRPQIDAGAGVVWRYVVTNTGDWPLTAVNLVDDVEGAISCPVLPGSPSLLLPGQSITCTETGVATAQPGGADYVNVGTVTGTPLPPSTGVLPEPTDDDPYLEDGPDQGLAIIRLKRGR